MGGHLQLLGRRRRRYAFPFAGRLQILTRVPDLASLTVVLLLFAVGVRSSQYATSIEILLAFEADHTPLPREGQVSRSRPTLPQIKVEATTEHRSDDFNSATCMSIRKVCYFRTGTQVRVRRLRNNCYRPRFRYYYVMTTVCPSSRRLTAVDNEQD